MYFYLLLFKKSKDIVKDLRYVSLFYSVIIVKLVQTLHELLFQ